MSARSAAGWAVLQAVATVTAATSGSAQLPHAAAAPPTAREVAGIVSLGRTSGLRALPGSWVTLHRVGADRAGALDSMRTPADGRFRFRYRVFGDTNALYFVSSRYAGIAYFTAPFRGARVDDGAADLVVFDTTSGPVPIHVRGRHIVVMNATAGTRTVVEAWELANDSSVTRVAKGGEAVFESVLPDGVSDVQAREGDLAPESITFINGRLRVSAPIAPGVKQFSLSYRLGWRGSTLSVPVLVPVAVLEVLGEGDSTVASGAGLVEAQSTELNGRRFRRFLAREVPAGAVVTLMSQTATATLNPRIALVVIAAGVAMLLLLLRNFGRRNFRARARADRDDPDDIARQLRALDATFANLADPTADQKADHYQARAHLSSRRTAALARRDARA